MAIESKYKGNPLQVPITEEMSDLIDRIASRDKTSRAAVARDVLEEHLRDIAPGSELAPALEARGFFGSGDVV